MTRQEAWKTGVLKFSFWALNLGLVLMIVLSLLPVGILQTIASMEHGMWYARSADFLQQPLLEKLRWLRVIGDTVFALGAVGIGWFVIGLKTGWSLEGKLTEPEPDAVAEPAN
jgi:nitric oxide reductase subunit B